MGSWSVRRYLPHLVQANTAICYRRRDKKIIACHAKTCGFSMRAFAQYLCAKRPLSSNILHSGPTRPVRSGLERWACLYGQILGVAVSAVKRGPFVNFRHGQT